CLIDLYVTRYDKLGAQQPAVKSAVREAFAGAYDAQGALVRNGFEKLRAELLVMLGDDAYTQALSSRFDLAGLGIAAFEGTGFEGAGGLDLSGVAGAEMYDLYLATQYYQLVLERFGKLLTPLWRIVSENNGANSDPVVGSAAVNELLGRVIRASSQKARVFG